MTSDGIPLYHTNKNSKICKELFTGFISAMTSFASEIFVEKCQCIQMKSFKFTILYHSEPNLIFICRSDAHVSEIKVKFYLNILKRKFLADHQFDLENFKGKMEQFNHLDF
ncbi:hypothetical protein [Candidatus Lokiarchaeum ossiferum]|uniref:hypothetical protein n=1 Tax=Candidatus Lokiarchaeum ossiferum TaxID=2951803 RepID=UPI00352CB8D0